MRGGACRAESKGARSGESQGCPRRGRGWDGNRSARCMVLLGEGSEERGGFMDNNRGRGGVERVGCAKGYQLGRCIGTEDASMRALGLTDELGVEFSGLSIVESCNMGAAKYAGLPCGRRFMAADPGQPGHRGCRGGKLRQGRRQGRDRQRKQRDLLGGVPGA